MSNEPVTKKSRDRSLEDSCDLQSAAGKSSSDGKNIGAESKSASGASGGRITKKDSKQQGARAKKYTPKKYADLCDCLSTDCPGCFMPCPQCSSLKCGHECRVDRAWNYDSYEIEGTGIVVKHPGSKGSK